MFSGLFFSFFSFCLCAFRVLSSPPLTGLPETAEAVVYPQCIFQFCCSAPLRTVSYVLTCAQRLPRGSVTVFLRFCGFTVTPPASLTYFDRDPTSSLVSARCHGRMDAANVLINLVLVILYFVNAASVIKVLAVGILSFVQLGGYLVVRPHMLQQLNAIRAGVSAACLWVTMCVIVSVSLTRQVQHI